MKRKIYIWDWSKTKKQWNCAQGICLGISYFPKPGL